MKLIALGIFLIVIVSVIAVHEGNGGYSGVNGMLARQNDPYSRERYFGPSVQYPFGGFGGYASNVANYGKEGATSSRANLDTNSFISQGRNPSRVITNNDPGMRGYRVLDAVVDLEADDSVQIEEKPVLAKGTARVLSRGDAFGSVTNGDSEEPSMVLIQTRNLPPVGDYQIYEAWLVDEDNNYAMSLGLLRSGIDLTAQLRFTISRSLLPFEAVMITLEEFPDENPGPGKVVLSGKIPSSREFPAFGSQVEEALR